MSNARRTTTTRDRQSTESAPVELVQVDPATLLVDVNIRSAAELGKEFVASIREQGVLVPIVAGRVEVDGQAQLRVRYGHRRTLGAVQAARPLVPVVIVPDSDESDEAAREAARIVAQWSENEHRAGLSTADKVAAVEQLAAFGVSAAQIAKRTHTKRTEVDAALAASGSTLAKAATAKYEFLTLDQSAAIAEFDTTDEVDTETVKALVVAAKEGDGTFAHVLQSARDARAERAAVQAATDALAAAGVRVIQAPSHDDSTVRRLAELAAKANGPAIDADQHASCPGHVGWVEARWNTIRTVYGCEGWSGHGHVDRWAHRNQPAKVKAADMSEAERETARVERRRVIENNKAWKSAESVRRSWLTAFCARKTAPKGAAGFLAAELLTGGYELRQAMERVEVLAELLDVQRTVNLRQSLAGFAAGATDGRSMVLALAVVLAAHEQATGVHTWRSGSATAARYFSYLAELGYELSDVEKLAAGIKPGRRRSTTAA